jgi:hypothetical protein
MAKRKARRVSRSAARKVKTVVRESRKGMTLGLAIIALILNVLILPGFGTLVAGRSKNGAWQIALSVIGIIFVSAAYIYETPILYIGSPLWIAAWIWGLVSGIKFIQEAG